MDAAPKPPLDDAPEADTDRRKERPTVLVVDDYDDAREMYSEYLQYIGYDVLTACNGQEAIDRAQQSRPDVILMDLSLPAISGWEATRRLKQDERTRDIPVMALTGHVFPTHEEQAHRAGCDAFVTKPAAPATVADQILALLQKTGSKPRTS